MSNSSQLVLGIDLEGINKDLVNSGVDTSVDRVIEVGAVLWDWNLAQPVKMISELIDEVDRLKISQEVEELTGINDDILENWALKGEDIKRFLESFAKVIEKADYLMAHNSSGYDEPMLEALFKRYALEMPKKPWINTLTDIEFPRRMKQRSMAMLEHSHGFINPFPHRALTDVLSMLKIASQYDLGRMTKLAKSPMVTIAAKLDAPNWKNKDEVQEFNVTKNKVAKSKFKWNPSIKLWTKEVHQVIIDEGRLNYDFEWYIK